MTKTTQIAIALLFASTLLAASASTYYIDYSSGADANTGTSKAQDVT